MGFAMVDAAVAAGVKNFVFSSVLHAITTDLVQHAIKRDIEEHLLSSGLEFTILQPANYMLPLKLKSVFSDSVFKLSWSLDRRQSLVDLDDVTDVAMEVLANSERAETTDSGRGNQRRRLPQCLVWRYRSRRISPSGKRAALHYSTL